MTDKDKEEIQQVRNQVRSKLIKTKEKLISDAITKAKAGFSNYAEYVSMIIEELIEENECLKSEHYKDEEIKRLQNEIEQLNNRLYNAFEIPEEARKAIEGHEKTFHDCKSSFFDFRFISTEVTDVVECKCERCREVLTFYH